MTALRVVEHYTSTQGEGPEVGVLTQFVRFAGCNLKCALWPCDSEFAINPKLYRNEQYSRRGWELAADIKRMRGESGASNVCLTGGEPFLQSHDELLALLENMRQDTDGDEMSRYYIEAFTNGTFEIPERFFELGIRPVMDWKLPGSGELTWINSRSRNLAFIAGFGGAVKFTVADEEDFGVALQVWESIVKDSHVPVFVGAVWGGTWTAKDVAALIAKYKVPWKLNVQVHQYIYGVNVRGT
jgi:7-carboxy-7-deazaguanine synthase